MLRLISAFTLLLACSHAFIQPAALRPRSSLFVEKVEGNPSYKKVFVAGGTKGVGKCIVESLSKSGVDIVCVARSDEAVSSLNAMDNVVCHKGDAFDYKSIEDNMWGCDAVITTLGGTTEEGRRVDYEGNNNVIEAAGILGVTRVVLVTSIGCGDSKDAAPPAVFEALKDVLADKEKAERVLQRYYTNTNWTIIRPGGLKSEAMTGKAILTEDKLAIGSIHREDVADLVIKALKSSGTKKKILSAVDMSLGSNVGGEREVEEFQL
ncbi:hypothetical protein TrST_g10210 [Triparma strigata]|uniref:NAD(P)-binding domain-containing protein n=1 Tax=Triparma strigata TaxID=1606541 RepID=A0A9W7ECH2_9STRA|nr:hypothetical protein TrST_g10210 [Triparma strigata]